MCLERKGSWVRILVPSSSGVWQFYRVISLDSRYLKNVFFFCNCSMPQTLMNAGPVQMFVKAGESAGIRSGPSHVVVTEVT